MKRPVVAIVRYEKPKGCPPSHKQIVEAFHRAGIPVDPSSIEKMDKIPGSYMKKYQGRPEFEEAHFTVA